MPLIDVETTYRKYGPMVYRRCLKLLGDEPRAVEAMQDTFVQLLANQRHWDDTGLSSLLFRIATNTCLNLIRAEKRARDDGADLLHRILEATNDEESIVARDWLARFFGQQEKSIAAVAIMHFVDEMTLEQIAREVGLSVSGVRKRLRKIEPLIRAMKE